MSDRAGAVSPTGPQRAPTAARTAVVWDVLRGALARFHTGDDAPLEIVDAGGGTGGAAVPLAELGHDVTVVEPNPDSLAALERRAAEAGVRVRALQGESRDLPQLLPECQAHLVLMHNVLEYVDDPLDALTDAMAITRPGGVISLLATNVVATVLHRALAGHLDEARALLAAPQGRWGEHDPMPRRFTEARLVELATEAGCVRPEVHGVRVFADLLPGRVFDGEPQASSQLLDLERAAAQSPELRGIATQLHLLVERPE
ncbi:methyltransferase [Salinactinospora qingdaonensis]|uniref:Methyltransferase n=1 Tax=Salinactinospora qingdaonensis TaxID=702744 RepID=A0ABP7FP84_9ACTN